MKNILYIGGFELPDKNAAAQRVMSNAKLLRKMGFEVSFIGISKDIQNAPSNVVGFVSNPVPYPTSTKQWIHQIVTFVDTHLILDRKPNYVILYNFPAIASLRILKACHKHGIKVIQDITEWESATSFTPREFIHWLDINLRMKYAIKKMDGVIAISKLLYEYYKKYTSTILIPPTIDQNDKKWNRERILSTDTPRKLIYAGSIGMGNKDRLDKIIEIVSQNKSVKLDIIGITEQQYISTFKKKIPNSENIHFWGRVSHKIAVECVQKADFQLLIRDSTLKNNAGFPTKLVESLTCCTPLIATNISNICDYLVDGENGFVVSNSQSLKTIIEKISLMSTQDIIKMKNNCRDMTCFDYRNYKDDFQKLFC